MAKSNGTPLVGAPVVSVLMPTFNQENYISEAIEGVINQITDFNFEFIIGDDCSTDQTKFIISKYRKLYPDRIDVITPPHNIGMQRNWVNLIKAARGEFVAFCEGDDYWSDVRKLQRQVEALKTNLSADICYHPCLRRAGVATPISRPSCYHSISKKLVSASAVIQGGGGYIPTASIMIRMSSLRQIPTDLLENAPVVDYFIQVYGAHRGGAVYLPFAMCVYRSHVVGAWSNSLTSFAKNFVFQKKFVDSVMFAKTDLGRNDGSFERFVYGHYTGVWAQSDQVKDLMLAGLCKQVLRDISPRINFGLRLILKFYDLLSVRRFVATSRYIRGLLDRMMQRVRYRITRLAFSKTDSIG